MDLPPAVEMAVGRLEKLRLVGGNGNVVVGGGNDEGSEGGNGLIIVTAAHMESPYNKEDASGPI